MSVHRNLVVTVADGICHVLLNRPERQNAFSLDLLDELWGALREADEDPAVRVVVVSAAGRVFCSGLSADDEVSERDTTHDVHPWRLRTPIIGAINGSAIGVGLTLPLQWDIRIVAEDAKLAFPFVRLGLVPEAASTWLLPRMSGSSAALELLLTGRRFTGAEAVGLGIASRAVPADEVLTVAMEIARDIAANTAPAAVALTKALVWEGLGEPDPVAAVARENAALGLVGGQPDAREGVTAVFERRAPQWSGGKHDAPRTSGEPAARA
jgi:enoyl-CoA hydratase/carnithine racemase